MSEEKLLPCPFCGGPAELRRGNVTDAWVVCNYGADDICGVETRLFDTPSEAIAAWNRRTPEGRAMAAPRVLEPFDVVLAAAEGFARTLAGAPPVTIEAVAHGLAAERIRECIGIVRLSVSSDER